ncbi:MAG: transposase family protein, partial [Gemmatimonadaceae bacterium]
MAASAAALRRVCVSGLSSATHGAWCLWRSEGTRRYACSALKKTGCGCCGRVQSGWYDRRTRKARDLSCGDRRVYLEFEVRRIQCKSCGSVKRE